MTDPTPTTALESAALALLQGKRPSQALAARAGFRDVAALERALSRNLGIDAAGLGTLGRKGVYRLAYGGGFHVGETLRYLGRDPDNQAERVDGFVYRRYFPVQGRDVMVALTLARGGCGVDMARELEPSVKLTLHKVLRRFLGLEQPLPAFRKALGNHVVMGPILKAFPGVRVPQVPSLWEALCWAVIGQQINLAFAYRLRNRFIALGNGIPEVNGDLLPFPAPEAILDIPRESWREAQFSRQKTEYLLGLARLFAEGDLNEERFAALSDEEAHDALTAVRGLGPWSAAYGLLRALDRMDALPVGDAGLRAALRHHFTLVGMPDTREQEALMEPLRPYRGLATYYLWKSLSAMRQE